MALLTLHSHAIHPKPPRIGPFDVGQTKCPPAHQDAKHGITIASNICMQHIWLHSLFRVGSPLKWQKYCYGEGEGVSGLPPFRARARAHPPSLHLRMAWRSQRSLSFVTTRHHEQVQEASCWHFMHMPFTQNLLGSDLLTWGKPSVLQHIKMPNMESQLQATSACNTSDYIVYCT